jgi:hypothetical protein
VDGRNTIQPEQFSLHGAVKNINSTDRFQGFRPKDKHCRGVKNGYMVDRHKIRLPDRHIFAPDNPDISQRPKNATNKKS